jgi:hypothetical protein
MNINEIDQKISLVTYPCIFLYLLLTYKSDINDYNFSIILKLYLKNHIDLALNINLFDILYDDISDYPISLKVLENFYILIKKKYLLLCLIKKWHDIYDNNVFWNLNINDQIDYLIYLKNQFLSIFDCSKGGTPYHTKLINIFKSKKSRKDEIVENLIDRIILILKIFDYKIFQSLNIPLIKIYDFYNLDYKFYINYITTIFQKINKLIIDTLLLFENYNIICNKLNNLLNPKNIKINDCYIDNVFIC